MPKRLASRSEFRLAIICALPIEFDAVHNSLDEVWDQWDPRGVPGDENRYGAGRMEETAVVLVLLSGMGKAAAASAAANMRASYVNLDCALLVGICGAVPRHNGSEIMLGDVIIGKYITTYDFGRQYPDDFRPKKAVQDVPGRLPKSLRAMITFFETQAGHKQLVDSTAQVLVQLQENSATRSDASGRYIYPGTKQDMLFAPQYRHRHQQASVCGLCSSCSNSTDPVCSKASELSCVDLGCSNASLLSRDRQNKRHEMEQQGDLGALLPDIHVGGFASADTVMKSGEHRDRISSSQEVIAFEMEGAGVWDEIPCIIVKGVCDYADSHKNKNWQQFASATAASTAKAIICKHLIRNNPSDVLTPSNPICHYIPFEPNDRFVGREKVIEELKTMLFLKNYKRVALVGLGGMGKTQVALHLAHHVAEKMSDYSVFWIPALSMASYEQACTGLATKLDLPMMQDDDPKQFLKSYLESNRSGKWLFILDNADDESIVCDRSNKNGVIDKYLPQNKNGRILITTRLKSIAVKMAKNIIIELRKMSYKEAHSLMEGLSIPNSISQLGEEVDSIEQSLPLIDLPNIEEDKTEFFEALCYLPLAISQATFYMIINDISASEYLKLLQNSTQDMEELMDSTYDDSTHYDPSQSAVMTTWLISFNQIRERHPAAAQILSFITWIEPKAIPRSLLPDLASAQEKTKAIGTLKGYGFLSVQKEQDTFDIHSLVHFIMHQQAFERDVDKSERTRALSHIAQVFPSNDWKNRYLWQQYLPHALRIYWDFEDINPEIHQSLGGSIGWSLGREGRIVEMVTLLEHLSTTLMSRLEENDPDRLSSQHELASAYRSNGQIKEAVSLLEHVVAIEEKTLAQDHPDRLASQHELASAYRSNGQVKEAVSLLEHVVAIKETLSQDHPDRLTSQHQLALAYRSNGQIKEAVSLLEHVVAINKGLAPDHPRRLASQRQLISARKALSNLASS